MRTSSLSIREKVILIFASVHLVYLMLGALPETWRDTIHVSVFHRFYERITRCHQAWNMFETIPNMHSMKARLIVQEKGRKARAEGMVLPGLRPFSQHDQVRLNNWMLNVIFTSSRSVFREAYMRNAADALLRSGRYSPSAQVSLEVVPSYTRSLLGVRALKEISVDDPMVLGPFELEALASKKPFPVKAP